MDPNSSPPAPFVQPSRIRSIDSWSTVQSDQGESDHTNVQNESSPTNPQHSSSFAKERDYRVQPLEVGDNANSTGRVSWSEYVPKWLRDKRMENDAHLTGDAIYYGGKMETLSEAQPRSLPKKSNSRFQKIQNWLSRSSSQTTYDEESVADFHESEWTPPDSSYGAAIPIGGWIPKNIRRAIEATLIGIMILGLVFLVVTASIRVTDDAKRYSNSSISDSNSAGTVETLDDFYVPYTQYDDVYHDDVPTSYNDYYSGDDGKYNKNDDADTNTYNQYQYNGYNKYSGNGYSYNKGNDDDKYY